MMKRDRFQDRILQLGRTGRPEIVFVTRAATSGPRLGVFSSSFNPITTAHVALIEQAASAFSLDEVLALAGTANADKQTYDCPLGVRLEMLHLALGGKENVSIGISSTAFFVDIIDAIARAYPSGASPYFIVGFDTFVRILDFEGRYLDRYDRSFSDRSQVLEYLLSASHLIVAARKGHGSSELAEMSAREPHLAADRVLFLDCPADLGERSATEVRVRIRAGLGISGLVPSAVESYIQANRLYSAA
jgi:nicotinate (nicotinamide) nucleotide adenylyltransferase